jgi:hypothetical protein
MLLELDAPTDFRAILLDLVRWGWKLKAIADTITAPPSTLKRWWNDGTEPGYEYGRRLVKLHELEGKKRNSAPSTPASAMQCIPASPTRETSMPPKSKPKKVREPGSDAPQTEVEPVATTAGGESNVDEAIEQAQSGRARKIAKPKPVVPASKVKGDPERPPEAAVNQKREMPYAEAMKLRAEGKLKRSVLTELGWVTPSPLPSAQPGK